MAARVARNMRARAGRSMEGRGAPELSPDAGGKGPATRARNPDAAPLRPLPAALGVRIRAAGHVSTGNPPVPPPCSQRSLASGKGKGAFPRTQIPLSDPQSCGSGGPVCLPTLTFPVPGNARLLILQTGKLRPRTGQRHPQTPRTKA